MASLLALALILTASYNNVLCDLDFDRLCSLTDPSFRTSLLASVTDKLKESFNIDNGLGLFGICDPNDPNMPPDCANYNNPSVAYGSSLVPCPGGECPPETPPVIPGLSGFYQPKQDNALILFGCLPPKTSYFGIRSYLYEKGRTNVENGLNCTDALKKTSRIRMMHGDASEKSP